MNVFREKGMKHFWEKEKKTNLELLFIVMSMEAVFDAECLKEIFQLTLSEIKIDGEEVKFAFD